MIIPWEKHFETIIEFRNEAIYKHIINNNYLENKAGEKLFNNNVEKVKVKIRKSFYTSWS